MKTSWLFALTLLAGLAAKANAELPFAYLSDQAMDEVRGKFIEGNQITSFGIQMSTTWQDGNHQWQGVAANLQGTPGYAPVLTTYQLKNSQVTPGSPTETAGMASINGVAQVNQISGTGNSSGNTAAVVVRFDDQKLQSPQGNWVTSKGDGVTMSNNQLRVDVNLAGRGSASQRMGDGQIGQFSRIAGNGIAVQNNMVIQVNMASPGVNDAVRSSVSNSRIMMTGLPTIR